MSNEKFLNTVMDAIQGDEQQKNHFYAYIVGDTEKLPDSLEQIKISSFWQLELRNLLFLNSYEDRTLIKMVGRFFYVLSEKKEGVLIDILKGAKGKYEKLKAAGVNQDFIIKEIPNEFSSSFTYSYEMDAISKLIARTEEIRANYPECINYFINQRPVHSEQTQFATLYFLVNALCQGKNKAYEEPAEELMLDLMIGCFGLENVKALNNRFGREEKITHNLERKEFMSMEVKDEKLYWLCYLLPDTTAVLKEMARLCMILFEPGFFSGGGRSSDSKKLYKLWSALDVPAEVYLRYFVLPLNSTNKEDLKEGYEQILSILKENSKIYLDAVEWTMQRNEIYALNMLAIAIGADSISDEQQKAYIKEAEQLLLTKVKTLITGADSIFVFEESPEKVIAMLQDSPFQGNKISIDLSKYNRSITSHPFYTLVQAAMGLIEYSALSRNLFKLLLAELDDYQMSSMFFWDKYYFYTKKPGLNTLCVLYENGVEIEMLCKMVFSYVCCSNYYKQEFMVEPEVFAAFLQQHKEIANQIVEQAPFEKDMMNAFLKCLYHEDLGFSDTALVKVLNSKNKAVVLYAEELLLKRESTVRSDVEAVSKGKGKTAADAASRLLRNWENQKMEAGLSQVQTIKELEALVEERFTKVHEKNAPYSKEVNYGTVRAKDSEECVSERMMQYFVAEYILLKDFYVIKLCKKISEMVNPYDLQKLLEQLYVSWITDGAKTTYKNIMFPYALSANQTQLIQLKKQLDEWCNGSPALAAFGVQCLGMNGSKLALLWTDTISKKHKNKKVRQAALDAMEALAKEWGVSQDVLEDEIVPDFGFDSGRQRLFSYGERSIKVVLNNDLSVSLFDETGKTARSLPKPSAKYNDNEELAAAAKEELNVIKKQIQGVFDTQVSRITKAVFTGRSWTRVKWEQLFVKNPLMLAFATGLVWEELNEDGTLLGCFRYMEDGSFNNLEEEEYQLQEGSKIALLHPADLSEDEVNSWRQQLEDYEIVQPVVQLELTNTAFDDEVLQQNELSLYKDKKVYGATLKSLGSKLGFKLYFGEYGWCEGVYFEDEKTGICLQMKTETFDLNDYKKTVELRSIKFLEEEKCIQIAKVPKRLLSLGCYLGSELCKKAVVEA